MHTVIILSKYSSELLKDYRFLFRPFIKKGLISFCDWNESGTDVTTSVPDLYKLIKGCLQWRAVIVDAKADFSPKNGPVPDEKNPFDYPAEVPGAAGPQPSRVPIIRLTHMLCGYPASPVKSFETGYEYTDENTGRKKRVRSSELSEEEFYRISEKYKDELRQIYMPEKVSEEEEQERKKLEEQYSFLDVRPQEVYLVATRRHSEGESHVYSSWKAPFELESSDFCRRNNYPGSCRFLCSEMANPENSGYVRDILEFWLAILTLATNPIPASSLQAYKLYRLRVNISGEKLSEVLNTHLNKMEAAYAFVQERLKMKPEYSFEEDRNVVEKQHIPVIFEEISGRDLLIDTGHIGLSRDCPEDELAYWNSQIRQKKESVDKFLKAPRRAVDKAAQHLKNRSESFFDDEYELDRFQLADLEEELSALELRVLTSDTHSMIDEQKIRGKFEKIDLQVRKDIDGRIRRDVAIGSGLLFLALYLIGFIPYIINAIRLGGSTFLTSFILAASAVILAASGGLIALFRMRKIMIRSMERFNSLMREIVRDVNGAARKFEQYFSALCTFMKAQSVYVGATKKSDKASVRMARLRTHKRALSTSIERDEEIASVFGIRRKADFEKNVTRFFDEDKLPQDNALYYYDVDSESIKVPLNTTGDLVNAPYRFIAGLMIERLEIYEEDKEENE